MAFFLHYNRNYLFLYLQLLLIVAQLCESSGEETESDSSRISKLLESDHSKSNIHSNIQEIDGTGNSTVGKSEIDLINLDAHNVNSNGENGNKTGKSKFIFGIDYKVVDSTIPGLRDDDDFENWDPPLEFQRDLPYYMSGFDRENQPIWVLEWGHYDLHKYVVSYNKKKRDLFEKYIRYTAYVAIKSQKLRSTPEKPITRHPMIIDLEGFKIERVTNREIVEHQLQLLSMYRRYFENKISKTIVVNVNSVAEVFVNLARPFFGRIWDKLELYGTQKSVWAPKLLKHFPKDQIPEWYGGSKGFKPVYVIG